MPKKKDNQFNAESDGVKSGAPGDEGTAATTPRTTKTRAKDTRMVEMLRRHKEERDNLKSTIKGEALAKKLKKQFTPVALSNLAALITPEPAKPEQQAP
jgi:hypothetical protein